MCFTATGCPDYEPDSSSAWVRYSPDRETAEVGCHGSSVGQTWQLVCRAGDWTGYVDNCSPLGTSTAHQLLQPVDLSPSIHGVQ